MNKTKSLLPIIIFLITTCLGVFSIIYSLKLSKQSQAQIDEKAGEIYWAVDCGGDPWSCHHRGRIAATVVCRQALSSGYKDFIISGAKITLQANILDLTHDRVAETKNRTCTTGSDGRCAIEQDVGATMGVDFLNIKVAELPEQISFTIDQALILADGRTINPGTYTVSRDDLTGLNAVGCFPGGRVDMKNKYTTCCGGFDGDSCICDTAANCSNGIVHQCLRLGSCTGPSPGQYPQLTYIYSNCLPQPSPSPSPMSFVCTDLTRNPTIDLKIGDTVSFTCSHTAENVQFDHYEFRWSADGGANYTVLDANNTSGTTGPHTVNQDGTYIVQCRVCATTGSVPCTDWGQATGWVNDDTSPSPTSSPPSGSNLALNKAVTVSKEWTGNNCTKECAVDGKTGNGWNGGDYAPQWIVIDLGAAYSINKVRLMAEGAPIGTVHYDIQGSPNGSSYTTIFSGSAVSDYSSWAEHTFNPTNTRYVRIYCKDWAGSWVAIREIEVY